MPHTAGAEVRGSTEGSPLSMVLLEVLEHQPKACPGPVDPPCLHSSPATLVSIFPFSSGVN